MQVPAKKQCQSSLEMSPYLFFSSSLALPGAALQQMRSSNP